MSVLAFIFILFACMLCGFSQKRHYRSLMFVEGIVQKSCVAFFYRSAAFVLFITACFILIYHYGWGMGVVWLFAQFTVAAFFQVVIITLITRIHS